MTTNPHIEKLDPLLAPLQGINLIEASAGTGKTYTITTLFIRLILEKNLTVNNILVVTFTEAATEELRDRIRRRLRETLTAFQQEDKSDEVLAGLMPQDQAQRRDAIFRLTNALRGFDEASIFTIHSFCRQMLQDNAFESGVLFDTELVSDQSHLLREIVEDFWRQEVYEITQLFTTYLLENGYNKPSSLLKTLNYGQYVGQPFLNIIPEEQAPLLEAKSLAFYTAFTETQQLWHAHAKEIEDLLLNHKSLNRNKYRKNSVSQWCQALDIFFNALSLSINVPEKLVKFTPSELANSIKKGQTPPEHPFFNQCEKLHTHQQALFQAFEQHLLVLKLKLFDIAEQRLRDKKQQEHIQSFDDLLINLYKALKGEHGDTLAELIRKKFHAALIDEFQDTDPVQYEIFRSIYGDGQRILFLIGDPKQAIYSFRGADIFTYLMACRDAKHRYTLATNWRSEADLITGVNSLFKKAKHPFLFEGIPFQPVQPPDEKQQPVEKPHLKIENKSLPPLQLWFVPRTLANCPENKPITKTWAKQQIPFSVGYEIARLLTLGQKEHAFIGEKPLAAGDIAILVRTNAQALQMQKVLRHLHIPSVLYSRESLFASHEIMEIERVLLAIAEPSHEALIKAALTTDLIGLSGSALYQRLNNEREWENDLKRFQDYHAIWQNIGFIKMFRTLLLKEKIPAHLLSYADGERRLTNVLHAGELLQQATVQNKLGINGLCQWLSQQRQKGSATEEEQLRLESDEKLVKIVTIHKSKGLEYPIVFCPFVWDGYLYNTKGEQFTFHNEQEALTLDLGSAEQAAHRERALEEERAENLRLFYVAITRAKHRCYLIWGAFKDASTSALAHLIHQDADIEKTEEALLLQDLNHLVTDSEKCIQVNHLPIDKAPYQRPIEKAEQLKARPFKGKIDKTWKVSSFSSLSHHVATDLADQPDYDDLTLIRPVTENENTTTDKKTIFNFPRGKRAGTFMHALFELMDFTQPDPELIQNQLKSFGYHLEEWETVIMTLVKHVLNTQLDPQQENLSLSRINRSKRLNELEFYYPVSQITPQGLHKILAQGEHTTLHSSFEASHRLSFSPVRGFMKGYIDMIFEYEGRYYLVDYKSNMLGADSNDYHHTHLKAIMAREAYILQYHLYIVALHRYLSARLPHYDYDTHFGSVYYLFLRGIHPSWGADYGIYRDRPSATVINQLSEYLF
jgi:exodeoxyribonuclease V beta subunit